MPFLLASTDWLGLLCFALITAAVCIVWFYIGRVIFETLRDFFRAVRKHGK